MNADFSRPDPANPAARNPSRALIMTGWALILFLCLAFYDALLFHTLQREIRQNALNTASMAASNLSAKIGTGVRLGKKLASFRGLERLVGDAAASFPENGGIAVLVNNGDRAFAMAPPPTQSLEDAPDSLAGAETMDNGNLLREAPLSLDVAAPILDRQGAIAGYSVVRVPRETLNQSLRPLMVGQVKNQLVLSVSGLLLAALLLGITPLTDADGAIRKTRIYAICLGCFFVVMGANAALAARTYSAHYAESAAANARRVGTLVRRDLDRLLLVGVTLGQMDNVEGYLRNVSGTLEHAVVLDIRDPQGARVAGSHPEDTAIVPSLAQSMPLADPAVPDRPAPSVPSNVPPHADVFEQPDASTAGSGWSIGINAARDSYVKALTATVLDLLTLVVVALIFMVEMFLLFFQYMDARRLGLTRRTLGHERRSGLLRPLMFFFILAMDMSISFIPLRMSELLTGPGALPRDLAMGLPVSVEVGMTGISVLLAGAWMKRKGMVPPMTTGMILMALGYAGSMLAAAPMQFVLARGLVGLGYGQCILTAQAYTVKDGRLADMFAGVYAGSLCGSALGAMLAERMGYAPVFLVSAMVFVCLVALPALLFSDGSDPNPLPPEQSGAEKKLTAGQIRRLLGNRDFVGLIFLCLMPSALLSIGFLNYFLPVFLNRVEVSQSNIGRVFMFYCLIIIYVGPWIGGLVHRSPRKTLMIVWGGLAGSAAVLCFTVMPPLAASLAGALFLGIATSFNTPSQSAYLLQLDIAKSIGIDQTMGLLNAMTRVGQVLGPLCAGAFLAAVGVADGALWAGLGYIGLSLLFLALARRSADGKDA